MLFVHGAWHASWCWEENFIPYFVEKGFSCSAFDLRGHGQSEGLGHLNDYSLEDYAKDLDQQVGALEKPPVLIAHSMGGLVAQKYSQDHKVAGLILVAPVPLDGVGYGYGRSHPIPFLKFLFLRKGFAMISGKKLARSLLFSPALPEGLFEKYYGKLQGESFKALTETARGVERKPLMGNPPLLIVEAGGDAVIPTKRLAETAKFYGISVSTLDNVAHDLMIDVEWKRAGELIGLWLDKNGF